jgi:hypothetical protein
MVFPFKKKPQPADDSSAFPMDETPVIEARSGVKGKVEAKQDVRTPQLAFNEFAQVCEELYGQGSLWGAVQSARDSAFKSGVLGKLEEILDELRKIRELGEK